MNKSILPFCLVLLLLVPLALVAQQPQPASSGKITGNILNGKTGAPLPYVSVSLMKMPDSAVVKGMQTDDQGGFTFDEVPFGNYALKIEYLGFGSTIVTNLNPRNNKLLINAGDIEINPSSEMLHPVTVIAHEEKPLITDDGDVITYNVGEDITNVGTVALDVLGHVPLVMVDASGNVTLEGQTPTILIDGRPSELGANAINDILQSLPADAIDHIEVMENPPAKYQASGSGGVINIVLKKNRRIGLNGRLSLTAGTLGHYNGNLYLNYRNKSTVVSGILSSDYRQTNSSGYTNRDTYLPGDTLYTNQQFTNHNQNFSPLARISIDHDFDAKNNLTLTLSGTTTGSNNSSYTASDNLTPLKEIASVLERTTTSSENNLDYGANLNFTHKFKNPAEDLTAGLSFSPRSNFNNSQFTQVSLDSAYDQSSPDSTDKIYDSDPSHQLSANVDYEKPFKDKKSSISFGYRGDFQLNARNYLTENLDTLTGQYTKDDSASNQLQYVNNVQALYGEFSSKIKSFSYRVGARMEYTETNFNLYNGTSGYKNTYLNLFPTVSFGETFADHSNLRFGYNMRINRPGLGELNPYIYYTDSYDYSYGNPFLKASTVNNFRITYSKFSPEGIFNFHVGLNYSYQDNIAKQVTTVNSLGIAASSYQNVASGNTYGVNLFMSIKPTDKLSISGFGFANLTEFNKLDTFNIILNNAQTIGLNTNINYEFSTNFHAEVTLNYRKATTGQGTGYENFTHSVAIQYNFMQDKMNLVFKAIDPFHQEQTFSVASEPSFTIFTHTNTQSRYFSLTWSWRFDRIGSNNLDKQKQQNNRRFRRGDNDEGPPPPGINPGGGGRVSF